MSIATKRKYVTQEVLEDYVLPEGDLQVVKVGQADHFRFT